MKNHQPNKIELSACDNMVNMSIFIPSVANSDLRFEFPSPSSTIKESTTTLATSTKAEP